LHESSHGPSLARSVRERLARADRLATALTLDLVEAGWQPTVETRILIC
jgi:ParB family chromosome partitioning protein